MKNRYTINRLLLCASLLTALGAVVLGSARIGLGSLALLTLVRCQGKESKPGHLVMLGLIVLALVLDLTMGLDQVLKRLSWNGNASYVANVLLTALVAVDFLDEKRRPPAAPEPPPAPTKE